MNRESSANNFGTDKMTDGEKKIFYVKKLEYLNDKKSEFELNTSLMSLSIVTIGLGNFNLSNPIFKVLIPILVATYGYCGIQSLITSKRIKQVKN